MRTLKRFHGSPCTGLLAFLAVWLSAGLVIAAERPAPENAVDAQGESIEEIEVTGRRALLSLRAEIIALEERMFGLFNELNAIREFDISCEAVVVTTSRIPSRECVPIYMKRMRHENVQDFLFSDLTPPHNGDVRMMGGKSMDVKGVQLTEQEMWLQKEPKHREFSTHFRELAAQHPELGTAARDLQSRKERLAELEEQQKNDSVLGRFFAGFGRDADE